jgi:signal transduction histidine kinase
VKEDERAKLRVILHELSNLLTGMLVAGGLLRQVVMEKRTRHYVDELHDGCERSATLVREARDLLIAPEDRLYKEPNQVSN